MRTVAFLFVLSLFIFASTLVLAASSAWPFWQQLILALVSGWLPFVADSVISHWEPAQIFVQRLLAWAWNRESTWNLSAEYHVDDSKGAIEQAANVIYKNAVKPERWQDEPTQKVIKTQKYTIRLFLSPMHGSRDVLYCKLADFTVPFRQNQILLSQNILPLFAQLERQLNPSSQTYEMHISFDQTKNPYYGVFVKRVPNQRIRDFGLELDIPIAGEMHTTVQVTKRDISIVTSNILPLENLAKHYLTLSSSVTPKISSST